MRLSLKTARHVTERVPNLKQFRRYGTPLAISSAPARQRVTKG